MNRRTGFTLIELLVVLTILVLVAALVLPAASAVNRSEVTMKDTAHLRRIHSAFLIFAGDAGGVLPTPGLINRLPVRPFSLEQFGNFGDQSGRRRLSFSNAACRAAFKSPRPRRSRAGACAGRSCAA